MSTSKGDRGTSWDGDYVVSADGRACPDTQSAIEASLSFENASGTGAGCGQDAANVDSGGSSQDSGGSSGGKK